MNVAGSSLRKRLIAPGSIAVAVAMLAGCKSGSCDSDLVDHAVAFMKAHQSCAEDADCVVVADYCGTLPGGSCGQLTMNREGRDSAEWADVTKELKDCSPDECTQCLSALFTGCRNGSCNGP